MSLQRSREGDKGGPRLQPAPPSPLKGLCPGDSVGSFNSCLTEQLLLSQSLVPTPPYLLCDPGQVP